MIDQVCNTNWEGVAALVAVLFFIAFLIVWFSPTKKADN